MGTMKTPQTEAEYVAERMKRHRAECDGPDEDPLYLIAMGRGAPTVITQRERDAYCFAPGWQSRRQAG